MPMTRAKATSLLNQREMSLYDDSRANQIRGLDEKALTSRIKRAREARDRARDLAKRQKLSSRDRTGNKRGTSGRANQRSDDKATLMADILLRFETRLKAMHASTSRARKTPARTSSTTQKTAPRARKAAPKRSTASGKTASRDSAAATTTNRPARKASAGKGRSATKAAASTATSASSGRATGKAKTKPAKKAPSRKTAAGTKRALTPKQALKRTRALLDAKQARDRAPKPWQSVPHGGGAEGRPGYQSDLAADRAHQLHDAEARLPAIMGSSSTRDRIQQGKRDHRRSR